METKTSYILDTNVLLSDCDAIKSFGKHNVILPFAVIEELDKHKSRQDEVGRNGRENARRLSELTKSGSIKKGVEIAKGKGNLIVISNSDLKNKVELPLELEAEKSGDNKIIQFCLNYKASFPDNEVVLVTKDILLQLKCDSIGIAWEDYKKFSVAEDSSTLFGGVTVLQDMNVSDFYDSEEDFVIDEETELKHKFYPNQFLVLKDIENRSAIVRYIGKGKPVKGVTIEAIDKLKLRNKEQQFSADLLMDPKVVLVSLAGKPGSGKTLLSIAAGLEQVIGSQKRYKSLVICRPVISVGKEIGFLPGTAEEKMEPWLAPIKDNLKFLMSDDNKKTKMAEDKLNLLFENGTIEVQILSYIRGRSISNAFMIIDESQNLSSHEIKTILTRAGENTKVVLTGDNEQIDNMYIDSVSNGLATVLEKFKGEQIAGHVTLRKSERSKLAEISANIL